MDNRKKQELYENSHLGFVQFMINGRQILIWNFLNKWDL